MTRATAQPGERAIVWVGSALKDLKAFPEMVQRNIGYALSAAQYGGRHGSVKPWTGEGPGVLEVVEDYDGDTFRAVYTVRFERVVYVIHAFQKKSPKGIETSQPDKNLVKKRLKVIREKHEKTSPKAKS